MTSLIRSSATIKKAIKDRMKELKLSSEQVIRDSKELNFVIFKGQLSNYLSSSGRYGLTEKQILFFCSLYGLDLNLNVGKPFLEGEVLKYEVRPYDKNECVKRTKKIFKVK